MERRAFTFPEATVIVHPAGVASQVVGFARGYSLSRTPRLLEDGSAAFYTDRLTIDAPWVEDDVTTVFAARGPFDVTIRWLNEDDGRLASVAITKATLQDVRRAPGEGGVEGFTFVFEALSRT